MEELWSFRDVLVMLVIRDIKLRYKQTVLGVIWVVLQPLLAGAVFALVFGRFARLPSEGKPYVLFVFSGLLYWNLLAGILQRAGNSIVAESRLITKVYFPRFFIPCAATLSVVVDFSISLIVMSVLLVYFDVSPGLWLALLPFSLGLTLALGLGVGLWIAALNVRYRDFSYVLPFFVQVWMYASPIVYSFDLIPHEWRGIFLINPMIGVLECGRASILGGEQVSALHVGISAVTSAVALITGLFYFRRVERGFADTL